MQKKEMIGIFTICILMALVIPVVSADTCSFCEFINLSNITRGVTDHAFLTNLSADNHPQYISTDGTRAFTGKQSLGGFNLTDLLDPVAIQDAATKNYVDLVNASQTAYTNAAISLANTSMKNYVDAANASMKSYVDTKAVSDHGLLSNLTGDGHPQYILVSGTRAFTGKQSLGGFNLTDLLDPVSLQDAATKNYVDLVNASMKNYVDARPPITDHGLLSNLSGDGHPQYILAAGTRAFTGRQSLGGFNLTDLLDPVAPQDAATKNYVDLVNISQTAYTDTAISTANTSMKNYVDAANTSMALNVSLNYASKVGGNVPTGELGSGTANATTYLRGDQTWAKPTVVGYTLMVQGLAIAAPVDNAIYVFGNAPKIPTTTTMGLNRIYIPKAGTIKAAEIFAYTTLATTTAETWGMDISKNSDTSRVNTIQNITIAGTTRRWSNQSMSTAVVVGDYIEIRSLCPAWGTNPANLVFSGNIYIE